MRVLCVGNLYPPHDQSGGYEAVWAAAVDDLRSRGNEVAILCSDHLRADAGVAHQPGVTRELRWYWRDHEFPRLSLRECGRLEAHNARIFDAVLDEFEPDVVAWWSMGGMSMGLVERVRRRSLPAVAFVHDDWLDYGRRTDSWHRRTNRLPRIGRKALERVAGVSVECDFGAAARYVFVSRHTAEHAIASGLELPDRGVAHSGIDPALLADPVPPRKWRSSILCVGRIDERKGVLDAVAALGELDPGASLTLVGGGDEGLVAAIRDRAAAGGEPIELTGALEAAAVRGRYDECDVVVFPVTWEEPWGLVPLEAMARGRPVVATGRGGSGEYLRDGENCLLVPPEDPAALAAAIRRLGADEDLRLRLVAAGMDTAAAHTADAFNAAVAEELQATIERARTLP